MPLSDEMLPIVRCHFLDVKLSHSSNVEERYQVLRETIEIVTDVLCTLPVLLEVKNVVVDVENNEDFVDLLMSNRSYVDDRIRTYGQHRIENEIIVRHDVLEQKQSI